MIASFSNAGPLLTAAALTRRGLAILSILFLVACAFAPTDPEARAEYEAANNPAEPTNRAIFSANQFANRNAFQPVARAYENYVPTGFAMVFTTSPLISKSRKLRSTTCCRAISATPGTRLCASSSIRLSAGRGVRPRLQLEQSPSRRRSGPNLRRLGNRHWAKHTTTDLWAV
jgi:hypothetical protein